MSLASQHPFSVFKRHRCSTVNKDLEIIQQALTGTNNNIEAPFITYLSKLQKKKATCSVIKTQSQGPPTSGAQ